MMKLVRDAYHSFNAEVVFITSNYQGNQEIMEGCKSEGIPAFVSRFYSLIAELDGFSRSCVGHALGFLSFASSQLRRMAITSGALS